LVADAPNLWRKLPFAMLVAGLLVFGFAPRLLTDKIIVPVEQQTLKAYNSAPAVPASRTGLARTWP
jgi:hypothetical protein